MRLVVDPLDDDTIADLGGSSPFFTVAGRRGFQNQLSDFELQKVLELADERARPFHFLRPGFGRMHSGISSKEMPAKPLGTLMPKFDPHVIPGFTLIKKLGVGSMSSVFLAEHPWLKRKVALKIREIGRQPAESILQERFRSGARIQAQLEHQHVVRVYDYLETKRHQVLVMQCVEGLTLAKHLEKHGLPVPDLLNAINGVIDAVSRFHALGCIHRDIKPLNLMFSSQARDADLLLTDFGVASDPLTVNLDMTVTGAHVGTLWYMPPEQLESKNPPHRGMSLHSV